MFTPAAYPPGTIAELKRLGVDTVHVYMHWADIAPDPTSVSRPSFDASDPAAYPAAGWAAYDAIVRETKAEGMGVILDLVAPPPRWASGKGAPHPETQPQWRPSAREYGQFVRAVATRYSGHYAPPGSSTPLPRVYSWAIWNEPNLGFQLAPEVENGTQIEVAPLLYRGIVDAAWSALHATGHGDDTILIGELGPEGATFAGAPGLFGAMPPLRFLRALYCVDSSYRPLQRPRRPTARLPDHRSRLQALRRRSSRPVPRHRLRRPSLPVRAAAQRGCPQRARLRRPSGHPQAAAHTRHAPARVRL